MSGARYVRPPVVAHIPGEPAETYLARLLIAVGASDPVVTRLLPGKFSAADLVALRSRQAVRRGYVPLEIGWPKPNQLANEGGRGEGDQVEDGESEGYHV